MKKVNIDFLYANWPDYGLQFYIALPGAEGRYVACDGMRLKSQMYSLLLSKDMGLTIANVIDDGTSLILVNVE